MECGCGCGKDAGTYSSSDSRTGAVAGQPRRYLPGHSSVVRPRSAVAKPPGPRLCGCGCRRPSGFYRKTDRRSGQVKGWPRRFLPGHSREAPRAPAGRQPTRIDWGRFVPPGRCAKTDRVPAGCPLSNAENDVMHAIARGLAYKQVAAELGISVSTVRSHVTRALDALAVTSRSATAAVVVMKDMGWVGAPPRLPDPPLPPLPPTHLAYAWAFTRLVLERTVLCENMVTAAFMLLCLDTGFRPAGRRNVPDIDALLLRIGRGLCRSVYAGLDSPDEGALAA